MTKRNSSLKNQVDLLMFNYFKIWMDHIRIMNDFHSTVLPSTLFFANKWRKWFPFPKSIAFYQNRCKRQWATCRHIPSNGKTWCMPYVPIGGKCQSMRSNCFPTVAWGIPDCCHSGLLGKIAQRTAKRTQLRKQLKCMHSLSSQSGKISQPATKHTPTLQLLSKQGNYWSTCTLVTSLCCVML